MEVLPSLEQGTVSSDKAKKSRQPFNTSFTTRLKRKCLQANIANMTNCYIKDNVSQSMSLP